MDQQGQPPPKRDYVSNEDLDEEIAQIIANNSRNTKLYDVSPKMEVTNPATVTSMNPIRALGVIRHAKLTREKYETFKVIFMYKLKFDFFPSYELVNDVKLCCYPTNVKVTSDKFYVPLEELAAHTTRRILEANQEIIVNKLKKLCTVLDTAFADIAMMIHMKEDVTNSIIGIYVCPMKLEYKGNNIDGTDIAANQQTTLWESDCPHYDHSGRPHLIEFTFDIPRKDYILETRKDVAVEAQKLSEEIHCFTFEERTMLRVSYSFEFSDTFNKLLADEATFILTTKTEKEKKDFLEELARERLEYTDPLVLKHRVDAKVLQNAKVQQANLDALQK